MLAASSEGNCTFSSHVVKPCKCVCVRAYASVYVCTRVFECACAQCAVYTCMCICMCVYVHTSLCHPSARVHIEMHSLMCMGKCVHIYLGVRITVRVPM